MNEASLPVEQYQYIFEELIIRCSYPWWYNVSSNLHIFLSDPAGGKGYGVQPKKKSSLSPFDKSITKFIQIGMK